MPDPPLIEQLSLDVPARETVAIVGPTGAGKTTKNGILQPAQRMVRKPDQIYPSWVWSSLQAHRRRAASSSRAAELGATGFSSTK
jgi:ABC-type glutathione transport system ATPase component